MRFEVNPEPSPEELQALRTALGRAGTSERRSADAYESVWRLAGLLENLDSGPASVPSARPEGRSRNNDGANRA